MRLFAKIVRWYRYIRYCRRLGHARTRTKVFDTFGFRGQHWECGRCGHVSLEPRNPEDEG